ncbi:TRAP-type C4-dicarboxylate transport system substrate-binding protein [Aquamicrobium lusatiense]|uniref:TRAP-type C4-dicarboxylate transport system substrate-binding protein n=1 Tax=Aquamicrobium lusatiense TaxID=89772 RepID=A0A7W9VXC2_9HYPH|nr:TRAP transporter substrate-binding protein DctP [Aquamicrobium lusatiense]MBB6014566.1 TRAP-type C4-dicarboxylate transport system substrate-binding protein [Aquamicrobium lusatiense]
MTSLKTLLLGTALTGAIGLAALPAMAREMTVATYLPANSSFVTDLLEPLAAWINERTNGEFSLAVYAGGTLGRDPSQQDRIVSSGIADLAVIVPGRNAGAYPDWGVFELPGLARSAEEGSYAVWQMHNDGNLRTGDDLHLVAAWTTDPYIFHTSAPITDPADVQGLRIRVLGQTQTESVLAMGGVPQGVSITETPEAISRGTLDGALADWSVFDIFRLGEVAHYSYEIPLGVLAMALVMNPESYAELSPEGQAVMTEAGEEWQRLMIAYYGRERARILETYTARGHVINAPTEEQIAGIVEATADLRERVAGAAGDGVMAAYEQALMDHRSGTR